MTPRLIVMLIAQYWPSTEGGAERQCRLQAAGLAAKGAAVEVVTRWTDIRQKRAETVEGVRICRLGLLSPFLEPLQRMHRRMMRRTEPADSVPPETGGPARSVGYFHPALLFLRVEKALFLVALAGHLFRKRHRIRLIHVHEATWLAGFGAWLGHRLRLPVVAKEASYPVFLPIGPDVPWRHRWMAWRGRAHYVAPTAAAAEALCAAGIHPSRVTMVPNGVQLPPETADPSRNEDVLYVGNLHQGTQWKAFDILFDAWVRVVQDRPHAKLVVVGSGDPRPWRQRLAEGGVAASVDFVGAVQDPAAFYRAAALLVLPSRREGMSNALLESQSWGVPAVVSDIPPNRAVIRHGENGLTVPVDDAPGLASAILELLGDPQRRAALGRAARQNAAERYAFPQVVSRLERLYDTLTPGSAMARGARVGDGSRR